MGIRNNHFRAVILLNGGGIPSVLANGLFQILFRMVGRVEGVIFMTIGKALFGIASFSDFLGLWWVFFMRGGSSVWDRWFQMSLLA